MSFKCQISIDFVLAIVIFLMLVGFIFNFANDLETDNYEIIDNMKNFDTYLSFSDTILSSKYYPLDINMKLDYVSEDCRLNNAGSDLVVGSEDNNFLITGGAIEDINNELCNTKMVIKHA